MGGLLRNRVSRDLCIYHVDGYWTVRNKHPGIQVYCIQIGKKMPTIGLTKVSSIVFMFD
jgi:hypothetical protein